MPCEALVRNLLLAIIFLLATGYCHAQGIPYTAGPFPNSSYLYVCPAPSGGTPCPSPVSIYSNVTLTTPVANPLFITFGSTVTFYIAPGTYTMEFPSAGYSVVVSIGGSGGGVSITTVSGLASVPGKTKGTLAVVTDGNSATDCTTGSGSTVVICQYSGSVWAQAVAASSGSTAWSALTSGTNTNTGFALSPVATGTVPFTLTAPSGQTVDIYDWFLAATKEVWIDSAGIMHFAQPPVGSAASLTSFPTLNQNTTGTASNLSGTPALPNGTTATTQSPGDNTTKLATDAFVLANAITNPMTTIGDMIGGGTSGVATRIAGGKTGQVPTATNGATPGFVSPGVADGNAAAHVTTTPYVVACDSSTAILDRVTTIVFDSGASIITAPDHTATGCGSNMAFTLVNESGSTLTVNRGGTDTFNITGNVAKSIAATSFTIPDSGSATLNNGEAGIWNVRVLQPASVNRRNCSQDPGADDGLKLQACLIALNSANSQAGIADATDLKGLTWSVNPFAAASLPASGEIWLPPGDTVVSVPTVMPDAWVIKGIGGRSVTAQYGSNLKASASWPPTYSTGTITKGTAGANDVITGSGTTWNSTNTPIGCALVGGTQPNITYGIISAIGSTTSITLKWGTDNGTGAAAASAYNVFCPVVVMGGGGASNAGAQFGIQLRSMGVDCNNIAGCVDVLNWYAQQHSEIHDTSFRGFTNIGLLIEGQPQNSGPYDNINLSPGSSCTAGTIPLVIRAASQSLGQFHRITASQGSCATNPTVGIDLQGSFTELNTIDVEHVTTGISVGANTSCPVTCANPTKLPTQFHIVNAYNPSGSGTTVVAVSNFNGSPTDYSLTNIQGNVTNTFTDAQNSCTETATKLGSYIVDHAGAINESTSTTSGCATVYTKNLSSLTIGFMPKATSATAIGNSICDEAITTANTFTCTNTAGAAFTGSSVKVGASPPALTGNGIGGTETTGQTGAASADMLAWNSTDHCPHGIYNNVDLGCVASSPRTACTNGELALSAGWGTTATVTAVAGIGYTCKWTLTSSGTGQAANPTITDTFVAANVLPIGTMLCDMRMTGGTGTTTLIDETTVSATAPVFTFGGTPVAASTYIVFRRCGE